MMDKVELDSALSRCYYPFGVPNPERLQRFFPGLGLYFLPRQVTAEGIAAVADALGRPVRSEDEQGYEHAIVAGAVHPTRGWPAWIECRCRELESYVDVEFRLHARSAGRPAVSWPLESYNPYFGCRVGYLAWHGEQVVGIYREKHRTYLCSAGPDQEPRASAISDRWQVVADLVCYADERTGAVERLALPDLRRLPGLSEEEARGQGLLPATPERDDRIQRLVEALFAVRERHREEGKQ
jgi:hypothetical protein